MKKVWIAIVSTEDCEEYHSAYTTEPTENQVKKIFFEEHSENYDVEDWGNCISCEIFSLEIRNIP